MSLYEVRVSIIGDQASGVDARFLGSRGRFSDKFGLGVLSMPSLTNLFAFALVALGMVLTPGPSMMYLVSRSICQGRKAGLVSLGGVALAFVIYMLAAAFGITGLLFAVPFAYDALRLAGSPYSVWRDIILTNSDNLDRALSQLIQSLEQLRGDLRTRALEEEFAAAGELYKILRDLQ